MVIFFSIESGRLYKSTGRDDPNDEKRTVLSSQSLNACRSKRGVNIMTTRLYFLVPDEMAAKQVTDAIRAKNIDDENIHAVANRDKYPLYEDIPEAGLAETSDVTNAAKRGAVIGGTAGLFAGLTAATIAPLGLVAAGGAIAGLSVAGAAAGTWTSSMIGVSVPNSDLKAFHDAIKDGQILMLADVDDEKTDEIKQEILAVHSKAVVNSGVLAQ